MTFFNFIEMQTSMHVNFFIPFELNMVNGCSVLILDTFLCYSFTKLCDFSDIIDKNWEGGIGNDPI